MICGGLLTEGIVAWHVISKQILLRLAHCFGYVKAPCLRVEGKLSSEQMEQAISLL
jgi:hypothetical protein